MNIHLDKAHAITAQIVAILYAIDETFLDHTETRLQDLHTLLQSLAAHLTGELEALSCDQRVVDAIYAVNDVKRLKGV